MPKCDFNKVRKQLTLLKSHFDIVPCDVFLVFVLLTFIIFYTFFLCFYCWLQTSNFLLSNVLWGCLQGYERKFETDLSEVWIKTSLDTYHVYGKAAKRYNALVQILLSCSRPMVLLRRNQSVHMLCKLADWFLSNRNIGYEWTNILFNLPSTILNPNPQYLIKNKYQVSRVALWT